MTTTFEVLTVEFSKGLYETRDIPFADAWQFYEDENYAFQPTRAFIKNVETGETFWTFAQGFSVWDATMQRYRLTRIGLGANGDGGPENPALVGWRSQLRARLIAGAGWVHAINWPSDPDAAVTDR